MPTPAPALARAQSEVMVALHLLLMPSKPPLAQRVSIGSLAQLVDDDYAGEAGLIWNSPLFQEESFVLSRVSRSFYFPFLLLCSHCVHYTCVFERPCSHGSLFTVVVYCGS